MSTILTDQFAGPWLAADSSNVVTIRDLASAPIPHLDIDGFKAFVSPPDMRTPAQSAIVQQSDILIAELRAADIVLIDAPMYNLSVPSGLKAYLDYIVGAGETFQYSPTGPIGLLPGKTAVIVSTRGGIYGPDDDLVTAYLSQICRFVGFSDLHFVYAEGLALGEGPRQEGIEAAEKQILAILDTLSVSTKSNDEMLVK